MINCRNEIHHVADSQKEREGERGGQKNERKKDRVKE